MLEVFCGVAMIFMVLAVVFMICSWPLRKKKVVGNGDCAECPYCVNGNICGRMGVNIALIPKCEYLEELD